MNSKPVDLNGAADLAAICTAALGAYEESLIEEARQAQERQEQERAQRLQEVQEVRAWMLKSMPAPLVPLVDLSDYSHKAAEHYNYSQERRGIWLRLEVPGAVPILFNVYRCQGDFVLVADKYAHGNLFYSVPYDAEIERDENSGEFFISYKWYLGCQYDSLAIALGRAISLWQKRGKWLTAQLERARVAAAVRKHTETTPEPEAKPTVSAEERIAIALESIAKTLVLADR